MKSISEINLGGLGLLKYKSKYSTSDLFMYSANPFSARVAYELKSKSLEIHSIFNHKYLKVRGLTSLICSSMVDKFEVKSISFKNLIENSTLDILDKINLDSFYLSDYSGLINESPFLRTLKELNFNYIEITPGDFLENLTGYFKNPNL